MLAAVNQSARHLGILKHQHALILIFFVGALSACASGPSMQELEAGNSVIPESKGRVVVYRTGIVGTAIQPIVSVDGVKRGKCQPNGAFKVDVAPGQRMISASTESLRGTMVTVGRGQTSYVIPAALSVDFFCPFSGCD